MFFLKLKSKALGHCLRIITISYHISFPYLVILMSSLENFIFKEFTYLKVFPAWRIFHSQKFNLLHIQIITWFYFLLSDPMKTARTHREVKGLKYMIGNIQYIHQFSELYLFIDLIVCILYSPLLLHGRHLLCYPKFVGHVHLFGRQHRHTLKS